MAAVLPHLNKLKCSSQLQWNMQMIRSCFTRTMLQLSQKLRGIGCVTSFLLRETDSSRFFCLPFGCCLTKLIRLRRAAAPFWLVAEACSFFIHSGLLPKEAAFSLFVFSNEDIHLSCCPLPVASFCVSHVTETTDDATTTAN